MAIHTPDELQDIVFDYSVSSVHTKGVRVEFGKDAEGVPVYAKSTSYDPLGRTESVTRWTDPVPDTGTWTLLTKTFEEYDLLGRVVQVAYPAVGPNLPVTTRYEYSGAYLKRVCNLVAEATSCADPSAFKYLSDVTYDALGRRQTLNLAAGQQRSFEYDAERQLLVADRFGTPGSSPYSLHRLFKNPDSTPAYDGLGNLTSIQGVSSTGFSFDAAYSYDQRNRISTWTHRGTPYSFDYDELGNLINHAGVVQDFDDASVPNGEIRPHAIKRKGTKTYEYDESGNTARITTGSSTKYYSFDSANRLVCIGATQGSCSSLKVLYDADGAPLREIGSGSRLFAGDDFELRAWTGEAFIQIEAFGERIARAKAFPYTDFIHYKWVLSDPIGSGLVELNPNGQAFGQVVFEPFGRVAPNGRSGGVENDYFGGHRKDAPTGMYQMKARWMNPETGTFLSVDPMVGDVGDPQAYNAYSYARNNPVALTDPNGMCVVLFACGFWSTYGTVGGSYNVYIYQNGELVSSKANQSGAQVQSLYQTALSSDHSFSWTGFKGDGSVGFIPSGLGASLVAGMGIAVPIFQCMTNAACVATVGYTASLIWQHMLTLQQQSGEGEGEGSEAPPRSVGERWKDLQDNPDDWEKIEERPDPRQPQGGESVRETWRNKNTGEKIGRHRKDPPGTTRRGNPKHPHPFEP